MKGYCLTMLWSSLTMLTNLTASRHILHEELMTARIKESGSRNLLISVSFIFCIKNPFLAYFPFSRTPKQAYLIKIMSVCPPLSTLDPADRFS
jgi:hypothetical protein